MPNTQTFHNIINKAVVFKLWRIQGKLNAKENSRFTFPFPGVEMSLWRILFALQTSCILCKIQEVASVRIGSLHEECTIRNSKETKESEPVTYPISLL